MVCYNITAYNEIINFTVSKREVYNSKLRAGIKAERGMVMKGKNLERTVILGLLLSTGVYGTAWADFTISEDGKTLTATKNLDGYKDKGNLSNFDTIKITTGSTGGLKTWGGKYNLKDVYVTTTGNGSNVDGIHLASDDSVFNAKTYVADINTNSSDALNLSHDASNAVANIDNIIIKNVKNGSGIRANASVAEGGINKITINKYADITISYYGAAAVWAGNSNSTIFGDWPSKTKGKGEVYLNGLTKIRLTGTSNKGIFVGRNGSIDVNSDVDILATGNSSYGITAQNTNITYGSWFDSSENLHGSTITMNGNSNKIYMVETDEDGNVKLDDKGNPIKKDGSKAIYADSKYGVIKSGGNGIGNIDVIGDIAADDKGKIDLAIRDWADITGNIEATNGATIKLGMANNNSGNSFARSTAGAINITGDVQAANGATIDLSLGDGAYFEGRVDDYKDADSTLWDDSNFNHDSLFDEDFVKDNKVESSGSVNLTLGNNSTWFVTEQSWATNVTATNATANNSVIDLTKGNNQNYAVHIGTLKGKAKFIVNLDPNTDAVENYGNMIYVYNGTEAKDLNLQINNEREVLTGLANGEKLRFATVANAGGGFGDTYVARGRGVINSGFSIEYEDYDTADTEENNKYNGGKEFDKTKPGSDYVNGIYKDGQNVYLVRDTSKDAGKSDSGATIINMSRANYKNAIYMDRLNKRMGEMRYVNGEEDQGMWVRLRHDRIGQSGDFRSMNTMYEVGYDVKQPTDNGEHRIGMAIDYMRGSTTYDDIMGKGETKRYGLWLYDTWLGEKGHYTDYIVKWGHLSNDFDIRDKDSLENITGDYSNNVFSVSAEYGKKNDMGNNWYFEPQAQLQLARVTGADYVTTQGSKVNVDGINSLIGRAGFRIGRDMDENSTVYLKADLLHEFMGDQTVTAADATGTLREEFENKGTWYDVGFGFATKMSKNSYAFMDFEKSFGNDNDETYQINAGMQWSF